HQPNRRLRLAAEPQTGRREVSALTDARKTLAYDFFRILRAPLLATFRHLNASKMQTFEQGLIDVYRKLSWDYRTNNPCRLGKKIIIENLLYRWSNGRVTLDCSGREALDDLVRPFYLLEGRNVPDFRNSIGAQYGEFLGNGDNVGKLLEGEYFTVRGYQKGTVHIVFKRSDLVEKLNDIIARHYPGALPPRV
ncbi:DUF4942 domain-containing protein, partial [Escherichia coli]